MSTKINKSEVVDIFSHKTKRGLFIDNYEYFNSDGNYLFYKKYLSANSKVKQTDLLIELMELSIKMDYYKNEFFTHLWALFFLKRFWYRLTFLDYTFVFRSNINKGIFISVNKEILEKNSNFEIRFQACINLYAVDRQFLVMLLELISVAGKEANHYVFYRIADFIKNEKRSNERRRVIDHIIKTIRDKKTPILSSQKKDILSILA